MQLEALLKSTKAYQSFLQDVTRNRISHAYAFYTDDPQTLYAMMDLCAKTVMCAHGGCGTCADCVQIAKNAHPDVMVIAAEKIKVEDVDRVVESAYIRPYSGDRKIYILRNASSMAPQAQNKLLKTLEEPPESVLIMLGISQEQNMLPTIQSRVKRVEVERFERDDVLDYLNDAVQTSDETSLKIAANLSDGSLTKAMDIVQDEHYREIFQLAVSLYARMKSSKQIAEISGEIAIYKDYLLSFLEILQIFTRDLLMLKSGMEMLIMCKNNLLDMVKVESEFSIPALLAILEAINGAKSKLALNCNANTVLEALMFEILEVKYKCRK